MAAVFKTILHGFLIGVANIIPGVSGGSMALALGIYERLIAAVGNIGPGTLTAALGGKEQTCVFFLRNLAWRLPT